MRLLALSDVHVNHAGNLAALAQIPVHPDDWLILAGDVADRVDDVDACLALMTERFARVLWVPGNHELWAPTGSRGEARYRELVEVCRARRVDTPEDPWPRWPADPSLVIAPLFLLYDYSFGPPGYPPAEAIAWAAEEGIRCVDEALLHPDPWPTRQDWCAARLRVTRARLDALAPGDRTVLINHWPLRGDLCRLPRIPRFRVWCGTRETEDWHTRYRAEVVVTGHLHMRATDWRDGVRFEEVSLGYPRHWLVERGAAAYLREILPGPEARLDHAGPTWHR